MKQKFTLNDTERATLEVLSTTHFHRDVRLRAQGLLMMHHGDTLTQIAATQNMTIQTVFNWRRGWHERGLFVVLGGHRGGRPRVLTDEVIALALDIARTEKLPMKQIKARVEAVRGEPLRCSIETLSSALKREGLSSRPYHRKPKRTEKVSLPVQLNWVFSHRGGSSNSNTESVSV
ncbi:hypothetical protein WJ95_05825 [Burkholderia ubonensis]|uniref:helix-turn-helix domain-containing protein n=1 Tax=Burkholderia ubonensis TaxID=101571 RepID=UPI000756EAD3|nr:helix-turn-helix domain-containing protein [Burkholderia ubonensis]KVP93118.1 hypothetical protein WJ95_05825 [Burkholderia ubonensis]